VTGCAWGHQIVARHVAVVTQVPRDHTSALFTTSHIVLTPLPLRNARRLRSKEDMLVGLSLEGGKGAIGKKASKDVYAFLHNRDPAADCRDTTQGGDEG